MCPLNSRADWWAVGGGRWALGGVQYGTDPPLYTHPLQVMALLRARAGADADGADRPVGREHRILDGMVDAILRDEAYGNVAIDFDHRPLGADNRINT